MVKYAAIMPILPPISVGLSYISWAALPRAIIRSIHVKLVILFSTPAISTLIPFAIAVPSVDR